MNAEYLENNTIWIAELTNGSNVAQYEMNWLDLKDKIEKEKINIKNIKLQFRDHIEYFVPPNSQGYFFSRNIIGIMAGGQLECYILGYLKDNKIYCKRIKIPELICIEDQERNLTRSNELFLIRNYG